MPRVLRRREHEAAALEPRHRAWRPGEMRPAVDGVAREDREGEDQEPGVEHEAQSTNGCARRLAQRDQSQGGSDHQGVVAAELEEAVARHRQRVAVVLAEGTDERRTEERRPFRAVAIAEPVGDPGHQVRRDPAEEHGGKGLPRRIGPELLDDPPQQPKAEERARGDAAELERDPGGGPSRPLVSTHAPAGAKGLAKGSVDAGSLPEAAAASATLGSATVTAPGTPAGPSARPAPRPLLLARVPDGGTRDPAQVLERFLRWVADTGVTPYPAQEEAFLELLAGRHVILSTPTGSGKSLVALCLHFQALCAGERSFYTAPVKALVSEKFFALCEDFGASNVGLLTGDASINPGAPIVCCTTEVLANMALRQGEALVAPAVVLDEFHYYGDRERGMAWQVPLLALPRTRFLLLSATLGDIAAIARALRERTGREVAHVTSSERPVPLEFEWSERPLHEAVERLVAAGRAPAYVVSFTQREAAELAGALTSAKVTDREEKRRLAEELAHFRFDSPYGKEVKRLLLHGIGVHHAGLLPKYRLLVEQLAQRGLLKIVSGTDTLGVGVNIPIRSVLFTRLCKYDGEKTAILSVRDFKQIAGRAGRKGFDDRGWVVAQAPEHVIENKRQAELAAAGRGRKNAVKRKPPARGFVPWSEDTFRRLVERPPEPLVSRFALGHGVLINVLQREGPESAPGSGYRALLELIALCHEDERSKRRLRREAALLFRALRRAGIVQLVRDPVRRRTGVRVREDLQRDFSLHHTLSLYLVEAIAALDREAASYALDVLSLVESILEDPRPVLWAQVDAAKERLVAELKAQGVPYEERLRELEDVTWPKPNAEFIYASFDLFAAHHPWVGSENIRPKSIAREMFEGYEGFDDYVRRYGLARGEGVLLRYLGQVHGTLAQTVPEAARSPELEDVLAFFRVMLERVDASLLEEWEDLLHAGRREARRAERAQAAAPEPLRPRALTARLRAELHRLVQALAARDFEAAARCVQQDPEDPWDAGRFEAELAPFFVEHERIVFTPEARKSEWTRVRPDGPRRLEASQVLLDPEGENLWCLEGWMEVPSDASTEGPWLRLRRIGT